MGERDDDELVEVPVLLVLTRKVARRLRGLSEAHGHSLQYMTSLAVESQFDWEGDANPTANKWRDPRCLGADGIYGEKHDAWRRDEYAPKWPADDATDPESVWRRKKRKLLKGYPPSHINPYELWVVPSDGAPVVTVGQLLTAGAKKLDQRILVGPAD